MSVNILQQVQKILLTVELRHLKKPKAYFENSPIREE